jgi:hypothetical protein
MKASHERGRNRSGRRTFRNRILHKFRNSPAAVGHRSGHPAEARRRPRYGPVR